MLEYRCIIIATKEPVEVKVEYPRRKQILELNINVKDNLEEFIKDSRALIEEANTFLKENKS